MAKNRSIYHCCIQKTASQWLKCIFSDPLIFQRTAMKINTPTQNFIGSGIKGLNLLDPIFRNAIVSPLYIRYEDFCQIYKPENYKAFFVMRDPRDFLISLYFSIRFSHPEAPYLVKQRAIVSNMDQDEGILYIMGKIHGEYHDTYFTMREWFWEGSKDPNIMICRYEDLIGPDKLKWFIDIFNHIELGIDEKHIKKLLDKYRFEKLTGGRKQGNEDPKHHFRKGVSGDWKNYFTGKHKKAFKEAAGQLLIDLGYEKDCEW
jgi:hypothetical protein